MLVLGLSQVIRKARQGEFQEMGSSFLSPIYRFSFLQLPGHIIIAFLFFFPKLMSMHPLCLKCVHHVRCLSKQVERCPYSF